MKTGSIIINIGKPTNVESYESLGVDGLSNSVEKSIKNLIKDIN